MPTGDLARFGEVSSQVTADCGCQTSAECRRHSGTMAASSASHPRRRVADEGDVVGEGMDDTDAFIPTRDVPPLSDTRHHRGYGGQDADA